MNLTIAINVLYSIKMYPAYVSKYNFKQEKQVILLMIPNGDGCHYIAVKKVSALVRGITSRHDSDFYCLNCLHSFRAKNKLQK